MAVTLDSTGTSQVTSSSVNTFNYTGLTVGAALVNSAAAFTMVFGTGSPGNVTVTWDGVSCTQQCSQADGSNQATVQWWAIRSPHSGNKTLAVTWDGTASNITVCGISFSGVVQTSDGAAFNNAVTNTGISFAPVIVVSSNTSDMAVGGFNGVNHNFSSVDNTSIYINNTNLGSTGAANRAAGAASVNLGAVLASTGFWSSAGFNISAAPPPPVFWPPYGDRERRLPAIVFQLDHQTNTFFQRSPRVVPTVFWTPPVSDRERVYPVPPWRKPVESDPFFFRFIPTLKVVGNLMSMFAAGINAKLVSSAAVVPDQAYSLNDVFPSIGDSSAFGSYALTDQIKLTGLFVNDVVGELGDPSSATLTLTDPNGNLQTFIYGQSTIVKVEDGNYYYILTPNVAGKWTAKWQGGGLTSMTTPFVVQTS